MHIVTVASPDKLSISGFLSFMRSCLGRDYVIGGLHSLMTENDISLYVDGFMEKNDKIIFSHYAKGKVNVDPLIAIPAKLQEVSSLLVWMDLYSMEWRVIKDLDSVSVGYIDRWTRNLQKMEGGL
jgi:hypothetical protein